MKFRLIPIMIGVLALLLTEAHVSPSQADDSDCWKKTGDAALQACTRIINAKQLGGKPLSSKQLANIYYDRGIAYYDKGQYDEALADYKEAVKRDPRNANFENRLGSAYSAKGEFVQAGLYFCNASGDDPKNAQFQYDCGLAYLKSLEQMGDATVLIGAVNAFDDAIKLGLENADVYYNRGLAHEKAGYPDEAIPDYAKAIALDPNYARAYNGRAYAFFELGVPDKGLPDVSKALKIDPNFAYAYSTRGEIFEVLGRKEEAIAAFRKSLELDSTIEESKAGLARLTEAGATSIHEIDCLNSRYPQRVVLGCTLLLREKSLTGQQRADAFYRRGIAYDAEDAIDRAIADLRKAIELVPSHAQAKANLERILAVHPR